MALCSGKKLCFILIAAVDAFFDPLLQVKVLCGTPEFVAPEVVNYDFISTGSGEMVRFDLSRNEEM